MIKSLRKVWIQGNFFNSIWSIYIKPRAIIILNGARPNAFCLRQWTRHRWLFSPLLFNTVREFLARVVRQDKEIKNIYSGNEEINYIFADDIFVYREKPKKSTKKKKKILELINEFSRVMGYKISLQKSILFLYTGNDHMDTEFKMYTTYNSTKMYT